MNLGHDVKIDVHHIIFTVHFEKLKLDQIFTMNFAIEAVAVRAPKATNYGFGL